MNYLLKIVEGPNKGAEVALVEGVAVTLGKGDDCDIVLVDPTMPDTPLNVEATAGGVMVDGKPVEQFEVMTSGDTSFAVGPAGTPWGALKWPKAGEPETTGGESSPSGDSSPASEEPTGSPTTEPTDHPTTEPSNRRRGGCCGCLVALFLVLAAVAVLCWFFRDRIRESDRFEQFAKIGKGWYSRFTRESRDAKVPGEKRESLSDIAGKYGLRLVESNGVSTVVGNLRTRRDRLAATAEAYQAKPWVELDLTDDESFRSAAEDALFTYTEGALKVAAATNRFLRIAGMSPSPLSLKRTLEALNADLPRLRGADVSGVVMGVVPAAPAEPEDDAVIAGDNGFSVKRTSVRKSRKGSPALPVCGILTAPYPCLVMRDGRRVMEGAPFGDAVVVEIGADSVTLTNSTGRFIWKP